MKSDNVNIDQLRKAWMAMGESLGMQVAPENNPVILRKKKTALDRLRDKYRVFWILALTMAFVSFVTFSRGLGIEGKLGLYLGLAYSVYFLISFAMDYWLWMGVNSIDPINSPISDVAMRAIYYKRKHLQFMSVIIPMGIAVLGFTGYVFSADIYFLDGMIAGAVCGGVIGIRQFRKFMACYNDLSE